MPDRPHADLPRDDFPCTDPSADDFPCADPSADDFPCADPSANDPSRAAQPRDQVSRQPDLNVRYVVVGAGAIGGVVGGALHRAGARVHLIARGAHLTELQTRGLEIADPSQSERLRIEASDAQTFAPQPTDCILLCTKSQDTRAALDDVAVGSAPIVCMQNGVSNERIVSDFDGHTGRVYGAMVFVPASFTEPGSVTSYAHPSLGVIDVGGYPSGEDATTHTVAAALSAAGFDSQSCPSIMRLKYAKLVTNVANVLQALGGSAAMRLRPAVKQEAEAVLNAAGIDRASSDELQRRCVAVDDQPVGGQAREGGSSWQSLRRGRSLETSFLNGEVVRLGAETGIPTPYNRALVALASRASAERWPPASLDLAALRTALVQEGCTAAAS